MSERPDFRHLNLADEWPSFVLRGVSNDSGTLRLARVPAAAASVGDVLAVVGALAGPAGVGMDHSGNLFVAEPGAHRILRIDACDGSTCPFGCLGGPGNEPGRLRDPHGVLAGPRGTLYVADTGNHRVQLVDAGFSLRAVPLDEIEKAGGSLRCCVGEVF